MNYLNLMVLVAGIFGFLFRIFDVNRFDDRILRISFLFIPVLKLLSLVCIKPFSRQFSFRLAHHQPLIQYVQPPLPLPPS